MQLNDLATCIQSKYSICSEAGELDNTLQKEQMAALHRVRCMH